MTIHAKPGRDNDGNLIHLNLSINQESLPNFLRLIDRALNCWDNAPQELKELGDMLTHGRITQDHSQSGKSLVR
jgi:hypothetical protein